MNSDRQEILKAIDAYVKGQLEEEEIEKLWVEIAKDPSLLDDLELEVSVKRLLKAQRPSGKATIRALPAWVWHVSAAAVIVLVALVQLFRVDTPTELSQFVLDRIKADQIETGTGIRSSKEMVIPVADSLLNLGFEATFSGNDERSLELFNEVIESYGEEPYGSKAFLNKGIVLYNQEEYAASVSSFKEVISRASEENRMILEKAYWFLANAYVKSGDLEKALEAAGNTYEMDGMFRSRSYRLYQKLSYDLGKFEEDDNGASSQN